MDRIRGRRLQKIRADHFRLYPLCVMCKAKGRISLATQLDHIVALVNGGTDTSDNRQGLCTPCHEAKTRRDLGYKERTQFDASGRVVW
jgi:5-methylcytosine-specific restriction protein A